MNLCISFWYLSRSCSAICLYFFKLVSVCCCQMRPTTFIMSKGAISGCSFATRVRVYKIRKKMRHERKTKSVFLGLTSRTKNMYAVRGFLGILYKRVSSPELPNFVNSAANLSLSRLAASLYFCFYCLDNFCHSLAIILTTSVTRIPGYFS